MAVAFDEMNLPGGDLRQAYHELSRWLKETPPEALEYRRQEAELLFRRIGITFAVYGDAEAQERLIPFDVIPRIFSGKEWTLLEKGLKQRVRALNMFLRDIYHGRDILRANIIPDDLIFQNPVFRPEMNGQDVPHDVYVHIAGIDIVRVDANDFIVLEDNARTPSGVSYMLENREIMMRLFPDLFARHRVAPVEKYPDELLSALRSVAPLSASAEPTVALMTPGVYNSAYYEHSFLADKLGIELVEGRDLVVKNDEVFMRTTEGLKRVDVIYRRVDDDFLDPLTFRPDSALGVPGLMSAYAAGNITLANAVGTGIADDKAIYSYMPEIVKFYLGRRADPEERADLALPRAEGPVLRARQSRRPRGQGSARLRRLRHADRPCRHQGDDRGVPRQAQARAGRFYRPADAGAVDLPDLHRIRPGAAPRRLAAVRADRPRSRHHRAGRADARRAEGRFAGGQFEPGRRHQRHLDTGRIEMLSRTAENLYWLARYVERAEYLARTIDATLRVTALPAAYIGKTNEWDSALLTAGVSASFYEAYQEANEAERRRVSGVLAVQSLLDQELHRGRAAQFAFGPHRADFSEMWDTINSAWIELQEVWGKGTSTREELAKFLRFVQETSLRFDGSAYRTMLRNDAYWFSRLGLHLERADNTARILDVKYHVLLPEEEHVGGPLDYYQWTSILRSVSALTAYHWVYRETLKPWLIADLLILNDTLPRSLASCYSNLVRNLDQIGVAYGRQGASQRHARGVRNRLEHSHMDDIFQHGVHEFIQEFISDNARLGEIITKQYLI